MFESFVVSVIYWTTLLAVFVWLNRRLSRLKERVADLERKEKEGGREGGGKRGEGGK
ncbi:MAG: hypothetical protein OCU12_00905 [Methanophagales archaeon]|nr:hypothetical protein [Methanophagales archaeon]